MFRNILYVFKATKTKIGKTIWGELLHGVFLATPSGILLLIVWELFTDNPNIQKVWMLIGVLTVMFILQLLIAKRVMIKTNNTVYSMTNKLRLMVGDHLQKLSLGFYKKRDPGDLASVALQDVNNFETIFGHSAPSILNAIFGTIFLSVFLLMLNWKLALVMLLAIPSAYLFVLIAGKAVSRFGQKHVESRNETGSRFIEYIMGIRHLKAFNQTGSRFSTLKKAFNELRINSIKVEVVPGPFVLTSFIVIELFFLLMIYIGVSGVSISTISIPVFIAFLIVGYRLYTPVKLLMVDYAMLRYMNVSLTRIIQLLKSPLQDAGKNVTPKSYSIEFKNVSFSYIERGILNDVSFTIPERGLTALVGASGSGKTTIASLIARFWDIQKGSIMIGGEDVQDMSPQTVYSLISQVFQDVYLFDDTVYNNIKIGRSDATEEEIMLAAKNARVTDFLGDLSDGIQTKVGEGGSHLSGGQKQRISIARAMLKNAPIVLFDEATASLDPENEIYIQQAIKELIKDKTVVVIAHKLQTIRNAGKIVVLDDGHIVETGKHSELVKSGGLYSRYWDTQQTTSVWRISR